MSDNKKSLRTFLKRKSVIIVAVFLAIIAILSAFIASEVKRVNQSRADYDAKLETLASQHNYFLTSTTELMTTTVTTQTPTTATTEAITTTTSAPTTTTQIESSVSLSGVSLNYIMMSVDDAGVKHVKPADEQTKEYFRNMQSKYDEIYAVNQDTFAWITVQGTAIDYEVMKSDDNDYYLNRTYEKKKAKQGSIFADYRVTDDFSQTRNCCMYGHCMTNGTMFRSVRKFFENKYGDRDEVAKILKVELLVDGKVYIYSVFSGYKSGGARFIHNVNTRECTQSMFYDFLAEIKEKSLLKQDLEFNEKSKIATLVTCTNAPGKPDERWGLHCLLTEIVELD